MARSKGALGFGLVGAGWRAEFYLRIAALAPERFRVSGIVARRPERAREIEAAWGIPVYATVGELAERESPAFLVVAGAYGGQPEAVGQAAETGLPILAETPPGPDLAGLERMWALALAGARIQVAEQYAFQPHWAAVIAAVRQGRIGTPTHAQLSFTHDYHAFALFRSLLEIGFEPCTISARTFTHPVVQGPGRDGPPARERIVDEEQVLGWCDFGAKSAVYDFTMEQYFNPIRGPRWLVRGERGQIVGDRLTTLQDHRTPLSYRFDRVDAGHGGNLDGYTHVGIRLGDEWIYRNPVAGARLADDEIAVASCLIGMDRYLREGTEVYPLAQALQDQYLALCLHEAARSGRAVTSMEQPWQIA